jgi:uncharacterized protein YegJ (DUF2314 family)
MSWLDNIAKKFGRRTNSTASSGLTITDWSVDDPSMQLAKAKARKTLPDFFEALFSPASEQHSFLVKFTLNPECAKQELIWACDLELRGTELWGLLANDPADDRYEALQPVRIDLRLIVDWRYNEGEIVKGNFTTSVLHSADAKTA